MVRVIDASVALKWFLLEEGRDRALTLLEELLAAPDAFAVPELFYFELAHVLHRAVPDPTPLQSELLQQVLVLGIQRFAMTPALLNEMRGLQREGLSGYDAAYVGLAKILEGRWVTFDRKAHERIAPLGLSQAL
jgi:predicted nucleic acid-binding protein